MRDPSQDAREQPTTPGPHISHTTKNPAENPELGRCQAAALEGKLVFKVDFGESLTFCDASYPKEHELHEIIYWDSREFQEAPGLFETVMKKAVAWNAQFIYAVDKPWVDPLTNHPRPS